MRYGKPDFSLVRLQARLATGNETLVEYFAGDRQLFIFVVNPDTIALFARSGGDSLHALIRDLRQQIFTFDPLAGDLSEARQAFVRTALPLYQTLIAPFAPLI
ncbi:hypothetical protein RZS08_67425, partial [Arthrospira platensis SPKY1]|nr:hypothetical protein [Arthrospira platensis SPKY1]